MLLCLIQTWSGGVPHPDLVGGYPIQTWSGGTPSRLGQGVPHPDLVGGYPLPSRPGQGVPQGSPTIQTWYGVSLTWNGVPQPRPWMWYPPDMRWGILPTQTWDGVQPPLPRPEIGYPPTQTWDGVPLPHLDLRWGTPYPDLRWSTYPPPASVDRLKI